ncbi:MAG: RES family NAD+ phosphorylase, partial [Propionivibrio sp.]
AGALLEVLAHANIGRVPTTHHWLVADVPEDVAVERHDANSLPSGWDTENHSIARAFGDLWLTEARSVALLMPSVVARLEWNALVNPLHPDASRLKLSRSEKVVWP